jgi:hypothetical protein
VKPEHGKVYRLYLSVDICFPKTYGSADGAVRLMECALRLGGKFWGEFISLGEYVEIDMHPHIDGVREMTTEEWMSGDEIADRYKYRGECAKCEPNGELRGKP